MLKKLVFLHFVLIFVPRKNLNPTVKDTITMMQRAIRLIVCLLAISVLTPARGAAVDELVFTDLSSFPLLGTLAADASISYSRLPDSLEHRVREQLWDLGKNSAGLAVRFRSDSPRIGARWHSRNKFNMNHMTATGIRGLDLYVLQDDSTWTTVSSIRPNFHKHNTTAMAVTDMTPGVMREYMLYLSLYDGVDSLFAGVDSGCVVLPPAVNLPERAKPIVMYGTSILQGGCATRPGMVHTSILGRMLQREVINLGFSGNARLDPEIAGLMAQADASVFVIDALPNCTAAQVDSLARPFVEIIRAKHPTTPIVLVESPIFPIARFNTETSATLADKNAHLRKVYEAIKASGDDNIYYFEGEAVLDDEVEATVDNYHFTDMGFVHYARKLYPLISKLIYKP